MKNIIAQRALSFPDNPIRGLEPLANQAKAAGINVIPLNIGAPDTFSPKPSIVSAVEFLQNTPALKYGPSAGNPDLIVELSRFYANKCGFTDISPENLMVTQGASEALDLVFYSIADQDDVIATPDPTYPNYSTIANKNSLKMHALPTDIKTGFHLSKESLKNLPTNLKAIVWSSPNNPTGAVYQEKELKMLLEISRQRNIWLIADEVYRSLVFNQDKPGFYRSPSILDYATTEDKERIIVLDSMSKLLGLCGARIGSIVAPSELIKTMVKIASTRGCPSTISQAAITSINEIPDSFFVENRTVFQQRRDLFYTKLEELSDLGVVVPPQPPEGAFYLVVELTGINGVDFAKWLLVEYPALAKTRETLFITPMLTSSGGFYLDRSRGKSQIRLAYVINNDLLIKAAEILRKAIPLYLSTRK